MHKEIPTDKMQALRSRMRKLRVFEKDMKESFIRSAGPGGQNVNKVSSCVQLTHKPSGISVKYDKERSQALNRLGARELLLNKFEHVLERERRQRLYEIEKERRQKRKRTKKSKEAVLAQKQHHSQIKANRKRISLQQIEKII